MEPAQSLNANVADREKRPHSFATAIVAARKRRRENWLPTRSATTTGLIHPPSGTIAPLADLSGCADTCLSAARTPLNVLRPQPCRLGPFFVLPDPLKRRFDSGQPALERVKDDVLAV
jgi:hypothetical protein